ncbi:MAG: GMP synthase, partial [Halobacteriota archaeon]
IIAENDVSIQGFAGDRVWGVQFHPEYDMATAREVTLAKDDLDEERKRRALESITPENYRRAGQAKRIFDNFQVLVETAAEPRTA